MWALAELLSRYFVISRNRKGTISKPIVKIGSHPLRKALRKQALPPSIHFLIFASWSFIPGATANGFRSIPLAASCFHQYRGNCRMAEGLRCLMNSSSACLRFLPASPRECWYYPETYCFCSIRCKSTHSFRARQRSLSRRPWISERTMASI